MKATEVGFSFIQGSMILEVPFFQRSYVWDEENWEELLDNLLDGNQSHFLGSIILKNHSAASNEAIERNMIIDGQQRLTTMSILLKACYDSLNTSAEDAQRGQDWLTEQNDIVKNSLMYKEGNSSSDWKVKINHSRLDADDYNSVIHDVWTDTYQDIVSVDDEAQEKPSNILLCYYYFRTTLSLLPHKELCALWNLLVEDDTKMMVKIDLDSSENEQTIFDTVNSTGVRLTSSDTIKNALFQRAMEIAGKDNSQRTMVINLHAQYWEATFLGDSESVEYWQKKTSAGRLIRTNQEIFLSAFAVIKGFFDTSKQKKAELPQVYKSFIKDFNLDNLCSFVEELCDYAATFRDHFVGYDVRTNYIVGDRKLHLLHTLYKFEIPAFEPYVLEKLHANGIKKDSLIPKSISGEFYTLESYISRHMACDVPIDSFEYECLRLLSHDASVDDLFNEKEELINDNAVEQYYKKYRVQISKEESLRVNPQTVDPFIP